MNISQKNNLAELQKKEGSFSFCLYLFWRTRKDREKENEINLGNIFCLIHTLSRLFPTFLLFVLLWFRLLFSFGLVTGCSEFIGWWFVVVLLAGLGGFLAKVELNLILLFNNWNSFNEK